MRAAVSGWRFLVAAQQEDLRVEFPDLEGNELEDLCLGPYNEACHLCGEPLPKGAKEVA